jgi:hypothetical protein
MKANLRNAIKALEGIIDEASVILTSAYEKE